MVDFNLLPALPPELLLCSGPLPPPRGPVRLSLGSHCMRARPSVLRECFARIGYRYEFDPIDGMPFEADLALNMLPGLMIAEGKLHGSRNRRTRAIIQDDQDEALLLVNLAGSHLIEQFGREVVLGDGDAILISGTDPSSFTHKPPGDILALRVPKARLAPRLARHQEAYMRPIPKANPALRLLRNYIGLTWGGAEASDLQLQGMMSEHIVDLLILAAGASGSDGRSACLGGLAAARLQAIKQDIGGALDQPGLSVAMLAGRHGLTARSVQRLFEDEGTTFTRYVLDQRLRRARSLLADPARSGEKISSVALDCGFGDVSYFNRTFRRHFGQAPSDIRAAARQ